jgi:hypothetical protein
MTKRTNDYSASAVSLQSRSKASPKWLWKAAGSGDDEQIELLESKELHCGESQLRGGGE